jgi:response regulator of citrate/malate metabolism
LSDLEHNQSPKVEIDTKKDVNKRREEFALLRNELSVEEAGKQMGISQSTAKRYETWRKNNKK